MIGSKREYSMDSEALNRALAPKNSGTREPRRGRGQGFPSAEGHARRCNGKVHCHCAPDEKSCVCGRHGTQCRRFAVVGTTVCTKHGANAKQIQESIKRKVLELAHGPALSAAVRILNDKDTCAACGAPCGHSPDDPKVLSAQAKVALGMMDRAGVGPKSEVDVNVSDNAWLKRCTDAELDTVAEIMERARQRSEDWTPDEQEATH